MAAIRDEQLNIRCSRQFKYTLMQMAQVPGGFFEKWTQADILHYLVKHAAKLSLPLEQCGVYDEI